MIDLDLNDDFENIDIGGSGDHIDKAKAVNCRQSKAAVKDEVAEIEKRSDSALKDFANRFIKKDFSKTANASSARQNQSVVDGHASKTESVSDNKAVLTRSGIDVGACSFSQPIIENNARKTENVSNNKAILARSEIDGNTRKTESVSGNKVALVQASVEINARKTESVSGSKVVLDKAGNELPAWIVSASNNKVVGVDKELLRVRVYLYAEGFDGKVIESILLSLKSEPLARQLFLGRANAMYSGTDMRPCVDCMNMGDAPYFSCRNKVIAVSLGSRHYSPVKEVFRRCIYFVEKKSP